MCVDPSTIFMAIGAVVSAAGAMQQADAQANAAAYNAQVQEQNRFIAQRNAADARERGIVAEQEQQKKTQQMLGRQKAIMADRMVDMTSGSPLEILGDTAMFGKLDALKTRNAYEREGISHETQAHNFSAQAELSRMESSAARAAGGISAFGQLASGLGGAFANHRRLAIT